MTSLSRSIRVVCAAAALIGAPALARAQRIDAPVNPDSSALQTPPGWSVTPSFLVSRTVDDNVLMHGPGDTQDRDFLNVYNPRGDLNFTGARSQFAATYSGAFVTYNTLNTLNSYEQHGGMMLKRRLSKRISFYMNGSLTKSPTTELLDLAVPYIRIGVFTDDARAGLESVGKRWTITAGGHFQQAHFETSALYSDLLLGGDSIGGDASLRRRMSATTTFFADLNTEHETLGPQRTQFDVQRAVAGLEHRLSDRTLIYGGAGASRLSATDFGPARSGPSFKLGISQHYRSTLLDVSYDRAFVPSFGFGGTTQNGSLTGRVQMPITRRLYTEDLVSWQQQDAIVLNFPSLRSFWMQATVGYVAGPWLRIEAYYAGTRQTVVGPDALLHHNQYGVQVVTGKPMRIR